MEVFVSPVSDPQVNMALESFFLNEYHREGCLIYRNAPCVILGKNQNPYREVNVRFCKKEDLPVLRRISGGGAVYHDLGNINTAFFGERLGITDSLYERWTEPPLRFLETMGVEAKRDGRNGLEVDGRKISGSAQALKRNRFLHHATLLFESDLVALKSCLTPVPGLIEGRGIASIPSPVTNVAGCLEERIGVEDFQDSWLEFLISRFGVKGASSIPLKAGKFIQESVLRQFGQWEWHMGKTPRFSFRLPAEDEAVVFEVERGFIAAVSGGVKTSGLTKSINALLGEEFSLETLEKAGFRDLCPDVENLIY